MRKLGKICWTCRNGWKVPASFLNKTHFWSQNLALLHPDAFTLANEKLTPEVLIFIFFAWKFLEGLELTVLLHFLLLRLLTASG